MEEKYKTVPPFGWKYNSCHGCVNLKRKPSPGEKICQTHHSTCRAHLTGANFEKCVQKTSLTVHTLEKDLTGDYCREELAYAARTKYDEYSLDEIYVPVDECKKKNIRQEMVRTFINRNLKRSHSNHFDSIQEANINEYDVVPRVPHHILIRIHRSYIMDYGEKKHHGIFSSKEHSADGEELRSDSFKKYSCNSLLCCACLPGDNWV